MKVIPETRRAHEFLVCFFYFMYQALSYAETSNLNTFFQENNLLLCNKTNDKYIKIRLMRTKIYNLVCTICFWNNIYPVRSGERSEISY